MYLGADLHVLASVFAVIFIAELPDKTALAALFLATRNAPLPVFLGTSLALTVQSIVAVTAGSLVGLLPARPIHIGAGLLFLISAVFMWRRGADDAAESAAKEPTGFWPTLGTTFGVIFIAEWGDLTQLGTAALAARYHAPFTVLIGSTAALWAVAAIAVFVGNRAAKVLNPNLTKRAAAVAFAIVGIALVSGRL
jgi:putative Ca2+/H+ antiporter (TMEM165/GDT1 family)